MLYFYTGAPGSYKTYSAVKFAKHLAKQPDGTPDRRVFAHNVTGLDVPGWTDISRAELEDWRNTIPPGSIVIVDEVAEMIPQRLKGAAPPWVDSLRTHRHQGLDLIFITQHPMDVDVTFRRLVNHHRHFYRQFGMRRATWLEMAGCDDDPAPGVLKVGQISQSEGIDKSVFKLYKSTVLDTHKFRIPKKLAIAIAFVVGAVGLIWYSIASFAGRIDEEAPPQLVAQASKVSPDLAGERALIEKPQCVEWVDDALDQ